MTGDPHALELLEVAPKLLTNVLVGDSHEGSLNNQGKPA
jgi:hypothetical protein